MRKQTLKKTQMAIRNRLIITLNTEAISKYPVSRESLLCTSAEAAQKIVSRRTKRNIKFATFHDRDGVKKELIPTPILKIKQ